jgi:hypothetical protein
VTTPAENRRRIAAAACEPNPAREEAWAKMIRSSNDILFAASQGRLIPNDDIHDRQVHVKKKEL